MIFSHGLFDTDSSASDRALRLLGHDILPWVRFAFFVHDELVANMICDDVPFYLTLLQRYLMRFLGIFIDDDIDVRPPAFRQALT